MTSPDFLSPKPSRTEMRPVNRVSRLALLAAILVVFATTAQALNHVNTSRGLTLSGAPLAIHGYDPVAYFTEGRARVGRATFTATHEGAAYRFVSQANQQAFEEMPGRYLPQYGGFCAFGVSVGAKFDGDPTLFRVVDGKLYFNLNPEIQAKWQEDTPGNILKADRNWREIRERDPAELT